MKVFCLGMENDLFKGLISVVIEGDLYALKKGKGLS